MPGCAGLANHGIGRRSSSATASSVTLAIASEEAPPVKKVSAAKAKIEAAKLAQQEKLASRGYGELGASCAGDGCRGNLAKPKASEPAVPKTFAEQLDFAVKQRESITGTLSEEDYAKVEQRVRPLATACIPPSIPVPSLYTPATPDAPTQTDRHADSQIGILGGDQRG